MSVPNPLPICAVAVGLPHAVGSLDLRHAPAEFPLGRASVRHDKGKGRQSLSSLSPSSSILCGNLSDVVYQFPREFLSAETRLWTFSEQRNDT